MTIDITKLLFRLVGKLSLLLLVLVIRNACEELKDNIQQVKEVQAHFHPSTRLKHLIEGTKSHSNPEQRVPPHKYELLQQSPIERE